MKGLLILVAAILALGALIVWERAAIVHAGADILALREREQRLEEEARALRMALARETARGRQPQGGWVSEGARTREKTQEAADRARTLR